MPSAQPGIFALGTRTHRHLEYDLRPGTADGAVLEAIARLRQPHVTAGGINLVLGFGPALWERIAPDGVPGGLGPFRPLDGDGRRAPATQHDLWVWLHGTGEDDGLDTSRAVTAALDRVAVLAAETPCFVYHDSRDLTGFVDGTENPPVDEAPEVALVPPGEPGEGGSHVLAMRWVHDLEAFSRLEVGEQERVIGRTKVASVELEDKPPTAHISRVVVEEHGEELEIYRRSTPYGTVAEHGLYFLAFSAEPRRFEIMLDRMFGIAGDGVHDRLTDFTRPVSGARYFAPSLVALDALGVGDAP